MAGGRLALVLASLIAGGCAPSVIAQPAPPVPIAPARAPAVEGSAPIQGYEVVAAYPHDPDAFTQGLIFTGGHLYESTGRWPSTIRRVRLQDGVVLDQRELDPVYFGEGLTDWGERLISLTWRNRVGFIWNMETLEPVTGFSYAGEGWGLTQDGQRLIMSDGTAQLRFLDPASLAETGRITVTDAGRPVRDLNELEWIDPDGDGPAPGEVWSNVWQTDRLVRIDPETGHVLAWVDLTGLLPDGQRDPLDDVLNGIAWDEEGRRLFVTGKNWPTLFEIRVVDQAPVAQAAGSPER